IAAKVAASMCAFIKKGNPDRYGESGALGAPGGLVGEMTIAEPGDRNLRMAPGIVFDDLIAGEDIGTIASNRPNAGGATWRKEQLRAAAGGVGLSYTSLSLNYDGTSSAQRQELVDKWVGSLMLAKRFIAMGVRKQRMGFIEAAVLAGRIRVTR